MNLDKAQISSSLKNKNIKDYIQISRKKLYKKYNFDNISSQKMYINSLIFNYKCRFTLLFKEFLILYDNTEFLRNFYTNDIIANLLNKILDIYYLYSKIYPNYINLKENKFLYKNIRKKQKMLDEKNESDKKEKDNNDGNDNDNKENDVDNKNELFTLSVRNEIKEFQENSLSNIKYNDNIYNQISLKRKKINDNWFVINNNRNDLSQKNNNFKSMSTDSFWTNDTNNLSFLLNAINEKIFVEDIPLFDKYNKENNKNENIFEDLSLNKNINIKIKEIEESNNKKYIYKKVSNKKFVNDGSRNNYIINKENINTHINKNKNNKININKPISASVSNKKNMNDKSINKSSKIFTYQLTAKTGNKEKKLNQYNSIERDSSDNKLSSSNLKTLVPSITIKRKFYSKDFSKENKYHLIKKKSQNLNQYSNYKFAKKNKFLATILNESKNDYSKKKSIENENSKTLSNNFSNLRNKKLLLKKYFTNNKFNQRNSYPRNPNITNNYSQLPLKNKNQLNSSLADNMDMDININNNLKTKTLNACHWIEYYNNNTNSNGNIEKIKFFINKIKNDSTILAMREKLIKERKDNTHSKEKCVSPASNINNRRYTLSNSTHYKKIKKINMKNIKLIQRQSINSEIKNKLTDIRKYIGTQLKSIDNNISSINKNNLNFNKSINKKNSMHNYLVINSSQKDNKNKINKLNNKENRNIEKIFLRKKFFSPTMTHYDLYKLRQNDLIQSPNNLVNNSDYTEFHQDNLLAKKKKENNSQKDKIKSKIDNKENISYLLNNKKYQLKSKMFQKNKSKSDNANIIGTKFNNRKNINIIINKNIKKNDKPNLNKISIVNRFKKKNNGMSKDKARLNELALNRFHNLSNSTINNSSLHSEFTTIRNFNNTSLNKGVNSVKNVIEFQTPFAHNKRLNLIEKFINQDAKEKRGKQNRLSNNKNISSKITIKVNRTKFLERVIDKMKSKTNFNKI